MDTLFMVRTLGYAGAPLSEFERLMTDSGLSLDGPLVALLRLDYEAARAEIRAHDLDTFHKKMSRCRSVAVFC